MRLNKRVSKFLGPAAGLTVIVWVIVWQAGGCGKRIAPGGRRKPRLRPRCGR